MICSMLLVRNIDVVSLFGMKRRRGKKGIKVYLGFYGVSPEIKSHLIFLIINGNNRQFEMGIEKIE